MVRAGCRPRQTYVKKRTTEDTPTHLASGSTSSSSLARLRAGCKLGSEPTQGVARSPEVPSPGPVILREVDTQNATARW